MGLISSLAEKFRKPKDMSEFNELGLLTDRVNPTFQNDLGNELMLSTQKTPERFLPNGHLPPVIKKLYLDCEAPISPKSEEHVCSF